MEKLSRLVTTLLASVAALVLASSIAVAQPATQGDAAAPMGMSGGQGSMMGSGMGMGMGRMQGMGDGGMGMGCMGGMEMIQMMQKNPKLMGRMMELQGEMMRMMSDAMTQRGKELQKSK